MSDIFLRALQRWSPKEFESIFGVSSKDMKKWRADPALVPPEVLSNVRALLTSSSFPQVANPSFTFIDLFAGIGGLRLGFEAHNGKCLFTSEWNTFSQKTYASNFFEEHPINGDITQVEASDIPDHDVLLAGFPCFPAGTLIETNECLVPIEGIKVGDLVLTHQRRLRKVLSVMQKDNAPLLEIKIESVLPFKTTSEHPFYVRECFDGVLGDPKWIEAELLTVNHYAALPMSDQGDTHDADTHDVYTNQSSVFWYILGMTLGGDVADIEAQFLGSASDLSVVLNDFGIKGGIKGSEKIPTYVFSMPTQIQRQIFEGWASSKNGSFSEKLNANKALALGLAKLARHIFESVDREQEADHPVTFFYNDVLIENGFAWVKVKSVTPIQETATVYNFEVEEDNSYVAESVVVHNCQPFSIAGVSKKNSLGRDHGFLDKTQGTLFFDVARIIDEKRPKAFLLENVKNLVSHDHGRTFDVIKETLKELGYHIHYKVIDAAHFLPQHRERIVIVGFKNENDFSWEQLVLPDKNHSMSSVLHHVGDVAEGAYVDANGLALSKYTLSDKLWEYLQNYAAKHKEAGNGFGYGLVNAQSVARTLSARYYKDGSEILVDQDGGTPRRLTPRECARLMGFPEHYQIVVSDSQAYKQFGNSVAVPVFTEVARIMRPYI